MTDFRVFIFCGMLLLAGFALFYAGIRKYKLRRLIIETPTSTARGAAVGDVEVCGAAKANGNGMIAPFSRKNCVYYKSIVQELQSNGKSSSWVTISSDISKDSFFLEDPTGKIAINPQNAELDLPRLMQINLDSSNIAQFSEALKSRNISTETGLFARRRRISEWCILPGDSLYIFGNAKIDPSTNRLVIGSGNFFLISEKKEKQILRTLAWQVPLFMIGGSAAFLGGLALIFLSIGAL